MGSTISGLTKLLSHSRDDSSQLIEKSRVVSGPLDLNTLQVVCVASHLKVALPRNGFQSSDRKCFVHLGKCPSVCAQTTEMNEGVRPFGGLED
jgi:hypothetical protein